MLVVGHRCQEFLREMANRQSNEDEGNTERCCLGLGQLSNGAITSLKCYVGRWTGSFFSLSLLLLLLFLLLLLLYLLLHHHLLPFCHRRRSFRPASAWGPVNVWTFSLKKMHKPTDLGYLVTSWLSWLKLVSVG